ncbi:protein kinase domain-containing protein [Endozoicomonas sp.]|uniref:protein kinase domain-containing protein n=1 Tax=Endozoicomonas sp. TaxID=1892382 RepID=UPI00383AE073
MNRTQGQGSIQAKADQEQRLPAKNEPPGQSAGGVFLYGERVERISLDQRDIRSSEPGSNLVLHDFRSATAAVRRFENLKNEMTKLGKGNYGQVYECEDLQQNKLAVKCHHRNFSELLKVDPNRGEVLLLTMLEHHPNIMAIKSILIGDMDKRRYGLITSPRQLPEDLDRLFVSCVVSEKVEGVSLDQFIKETDCDEKGIVKIFLQLASAVAFIHRNKCTHRDISTTNVMYDPEAGLKLIDFGSFKRGLKRTGSYVGALQLIGKDCLPLDQGGYDPVALDLSEMGAVILYCLTGKYISNFNEMNDSFDFPGSGVESRRFCASMFANKTDQNKKKIITSHLKSRLKDMGPKCLDIVIQLLHPDPSKRLSALQVVERLESI